MLHPESYQILKQKGHLNLMSYYYYYFYYYIIIYITYSLYLVLQLST